jgi:GTP diphosphokinase / guanosine-3',5'-bis(diphosphate) 3'-diphosphatase
LNAYKKLQRELKRYLEEPDQLALIDKAFSLAQSAHLAQKRHSGEAYITHPIAVAIILAEIKLDYQTIIAALLHDVLEDTVVSKDQLTQQFGEEVANLVDGVSKLAQISFETRAHMQAENLQKMIMAMSRDIRVIIIKLADRLHNMRTLYAVPAEKRGRISQETLDIYAPIANRLGMHAFRVEYEELCFSTQHPIRFRVLKKAVKRARGNQKGIISEIKRKVRGCLKDTKLAPAVIGGREKHIFSIYKKMRDKHLSFTEIMDIYGFRVVVDSVDMCYRVLGALHNLYKPLPHRFKDYIAIPKANGYQSLHTTLFGPYGLPIEVQIRTSEMDYMALNGIAAHWLYKAEDKVYNEAHLRARQWVQGMMEMQKKSSGSSLEFIENVKIDLFPDEVYVFTPRGNIMELPSGATPVDFAYTVHSDVGNTCVAAKIDRRLVPLSTKISSGQTIEIITASGARPNPAWLNFVMTGKARSNIRHYLKTQRRNEAVGLGERLVDVAIQKLMPEMRVVEPDQLSAVLDRLGVASEKELYEQVGLGHRMAVTVAQQLQRLSQPVESDPTLSVDNSAPLSIQGSEGMVVDYALCCRPIPGDYIVGFLEAGCGVVIHQEQCQVLVALHKQQPEQFVALNWEVDVQGAYASAIRIDALNQPGLLARISQLLLEQQVDISNFTAGEHDSQYCHFDVTIGVNNRVHLAQIFKHIRRIDGVVKVQRLMNT